MNRISKRKERKVPSSPGGEAGVRGKDKGG